MQTLAEPVIDLMDAGYVDNGKCRAIIGVWTSMPIVPKLNDETGIGQRMHSEELARPSLQRTLKFKLARHGQKLAHLYSMERLLTMLSTYTTRTIHGIDTALGAAQGTTGTWIPTSPTKREARRPNSQPAQTFVTA